MSSVAVNEASLSRAIYNQISSCCTIAIGGQNSLRNPIASALEIIRHRIGELTLVGCNLSIAADLLVGADLVNKCICGTVNNDLFGVTPNIKQKIQQGTLNIEDLDHGSILTALNAGANSAPYLIYTGILGTSIDSNKINNSIIGSLKISEVSGTIVPICFALRPDVALIHVPYCDFDGNIGISGPLLSDPLLIDASKLALITYEKKVPSFDSFDKTAITVLSNKGNMLLIKAEGGARPTACPNLYSENRLEVLRYHQEQIINSCY